MEKSAAAAAPTRANPRPFRAPFAPTNAFSFFYHSEFICTANLMKNGAKINTELTLKTFLQWSLRSNPLLEISVWNSNRIGAVSPSAY